MAERIYVASKSQYGAMWFQRRAAGWPIISTWIDEPEQAASDDLSDLWVRCIAEATTATALIAYHQPGEEWKGAFIEIGAALANGRPVFLVGNPPGSWVNHPLVRRCSTIDAAFEGAASVPLSSAGTSDLELQDLWNYQEIRP